MKMLMGVAAAFAASAAAATNGTKKLGIVNGDPTGYTQWKGMLAVRSSGGLCSGVAISRDIVLSAEHCCRAAVASYEILGGADINNGGVVDYGGVRQLAIHTVNGRPVGDLCMINLQNSLPASVPFYDIIAENDIRWGEPTTLVGYGYNTQGFPQGGLGIARMGTAEVEIAYFEEIDVGGTQQCACNGDSGGPMFVLRGGKMVVAGVTSAGIPGCLAGGPAIYSSIATSGTRSWLIKTFAEFSGGELQPGQCTDCSPGDCTVCPGFPSFQKGSRRKSGNSSATRN